MAHLIILRLIKRFIVLHFPSAFINIYYKIYQSCNKNYFKTERNQIYPSDRKIKKKKKNYVSRVLNFRFLVTVKISTGLKQWLNDAPPAWGCSTVLQIKWSACYFHPQNMFLRATFLTVYELCMLCFIHVHTPFIILRRNLDTSLLMKKFYWSF